MTSILKSNISDSFEENEYRSAFTFMNINLHFFHRPYYMLRQIMVVIITPLGHALT